MLDEIETGKQELIDIFMDYQNKDDEESYTIWLHLFPLISSIINYSEEVEHLDLLVDSFYTYHSPKDELRIEEKKKMNKNSPFMMKGLFLLYVEFDINYNKTLVFALIAHEIPFL